MIYVFGNSHSHLFTNSKPGTYGMGEVKNEYFTSISLGPVIAYNFYDHHYNEVLNWLDKLNINKNEDYIMLIVGEVDCRVHLPKQINLQNSKIEDTVNECVNRFFNVFLDLKNKGYKIIGWGGHPSTTSEPSDDPSQPIVGNCFFRNEISLFWDETLKKLCNKHGIPYISLVNDLINEDKLTNMDYFIDYCHLNHDMVKPLLREKFNSIEMKIYEN